jgi:GTP-binding protein
MQKPFVVVGTKADRLSKNVLAKNLAALKREHDLEEILPVSSKTDAGMKALWQIIMTTAE